MMIIPQTYGYVLHHYPYHPDSKSLGPGSLPCLKHFKAMEYRPARKMMKGDATIRRAIERL